MDEVKVEVGRLKGALEKNLETHEADFDIAWDAYAEALKENLDQILKAAKTMRKGEKINVYVNLTPPENHKEDYKRAIEMLDWHKEDEITITEQEFTCLVQDDWGWKGQFTTLNSFYTGSASPSSLRKKH